MLTSKTMEHFLPQLICHLSYNFDKNRAQDYCLLYPKGLEAVGL